MKYFILIVVIITIFLAKPWEINFAGGTPLSNDSTLLLAKAMATKAPLPLFPLSKVLSNTDSELPIAQKLDRSIEKFMKTWQIRGASFALMKDDKLIYSKGYGYADAETGEEVDVRHIFRIASVSKLITASGIMKLAEEGKLRLEDRVFGPEGILNDSIFSKIKDPRTKRITVEHLLRHQGGYTAVYGDPMFCPLDIARKMKVKPPVDLNTIIRFVLSRRLHYTPGTSTAYSNVGYGILTRVIEKVSGMNYEDYIKQNILRPAGCFDMHLGRNLYENRLPNEVRYYDTAEELIPSCDGSKQLVPKYYGGNNIEELYGAGGWVASASELLRFMAVIDGNPVIPDILSPESIEQMTTFSADALPIGWMHVTPQGEWSRTGTLSGSSVLMKKQSDGYAWVFISNTGSWKGPRFQSYINGMITNALKNVPSWPEKDLFALQQFEPHQHIVFQ